MSKLNQTAMTSSSADKLRSTSGLKLSTQNFCNRFASLVIASSCSLVMIAALSACSVSMDSDGLSASRMNPGECTNCNPAERLPTAQESAAVKQLVLDDVSAFLTQPNMQSGITDPLLSRNFHAAFGGFAGTDIRKYLDTRIRSFFSSADLQTATISPAPVHTGYSTSAPTGQASLSLVSNELTNQANGEFGAPGTPGMFDDKANGIVGAANIGMALWFQGVLDNTVISLIAGAQRIPADSSRVGIMLIGPGYDRTVEFDNGQKFRFPREYRQAILVHEARHSDCTGGLSQSAIQIARNARSSQEFLATYPSLNCGHMHVICPEWHELHGLAGCDSLAWGAYAIQNLYENGLAISARSRGDMQTAKVMQFSANESVTRLLYIIDANDVNHVPHLDRLWKGQFGAPDMSSNGVINQ